MILAKAAIALSVSFSAARAFSPVARHAFSPIASSTTKTSSLSPSFGTTTTMLRANVLKLSQPSKDLLSGVDVFIFDCDGVIWRVSNKLCTSFLSAHLHFAIDSLQSEDLLQKSLSMAYDRRRCPMSSISIIFANHIRKTHGDIIPLAFSSGGLGD